MPPLPLFYVRFGHRTQYFKTIMITKRGDMKYAPAQKNYKYTQYVYIIFFFSAYVIW